MTGQTITHFPEHIEGKIYSNTDNGNEFRIVLVSPDYLLVKPVTGSNDLSGTYFKIGATKLARLVFRAGGFPIDFELTRININVLNASGRSTLRIYQEAREDLADTVEIANGYVGNFNLDTDILLLASQGDRTLCVDLFDPAVSGSVNTSSLRAFVTVFGKPYSSLRGYASNYTSGYKDNNSTY